jgi:hypothetical protein
LFILIVPLLKLNVPPELIVSDGVIKLIDVRFAVVTEIVPLLLAVIEKPLKFVGIATFIERQDTLVLNVTDPPVRNWTFTFEIEQATLKNLELDPVELIVPTAVKFTLPLLIVKLPKQFNVNDVAENVQAVELVKLNVKQLIAPDNVIVAPLRPELLPKKTASADVGTGAPPPPVGVEAQLVVDVVFHVPVPPTQYLSAIYYFRIYYSVGIALIIAYQLLYLSCCMSAICCGVNISYSSSENHSASLNLFVPSVFSKIICTLLSILLIISSIFISPKIIRIQSS